MPEFSIIIPIYNAADTLHETLLSVKNQTFTDWEIVAVLDGANDESETIFAETMAGEKSVTLIKQANCGLGHARNTAAKNATGKWLVFLDADDCWQQNKLEILHQFSSKNENCDLIYHPIFEWKPNGILRKRRFWKIHNTQDLVTKGNPLVPSAVAIKKALYLQYGGFVEERNQVEDLQFWLKLLHHKICMCALSNVLTKYRIGHGVTANLPSHLAKVRAALLAAEQNGYITPMQHKMLHEKKQYEAGRQSHKMGAFAEAKKYYTAVTSSSFKLQILRLLNAIKIAV